MTRTGLIVLVAGAALGTGGDPAVRSGLALEVVTSRGVVWRTAVRPGEGFDLSFVHSAERCRWTQHYRVTASGIWQEGSSFPCLGAGMWAGPGDEAPVVRTRLGYTARARRPIGELSMLNWARGDIVLQVRDLRVRLSSRLEDFEAFRLQVR